MTDKTRDNPEYKPFFGKGANLYSGLSVILCFVFCLNLWAGLSLAQALAQEKLADKNSTLQRVGLHGIEYDVAVFRILDKMVAKTRDIELAVDQEYFDDVSQLSILVKTCRKPPPTLRAEVAVYLEIRDLSISSKSLFSGWMLASAPALSAMEHPLFDIWILDCKAVKSPSPFNTSRSQ